MGKPSSIYLNPSVRHPYNPRAESRTLRHDGCVRFGGDGGGGALAIWRNRGLCVTTAACTSAATAAAVRWRFGGIADSASRRLRAIRRRRRRRCIGDLNLAESRTLRHDGCVRFGGDGGGGALAIFPALRAPRPPLLPTTSPSQRAPRSPPRQPRQARQPAPRAPGPRQYFGRVRRGCLALLGKGLFFSGV